MNINKRDLVLLNEAYHQAVNMTRVEMDQETLSEYFPNWKIDTNLLGVDALNDNTIYEFLSNKDGDVVESNGDDTIVKFKDKYFWVHTENGRSRSYVVVSSNA